MEMPHRFRWNFENDCFNCIETSLSFCRFLDFISCIISCLHWGTEPEFFDHSFNSIFEKQLWNTFYTISVVHGQFSILKVQRHDDVQLNFYLQCWYSQSCKMSSALSSRMYVWNSSRMLRGAKRFLITSTRHPLLSVLMCRLETFTLLQRASWLDDIYHEICEFDNL